MTGYDQPTHPPCAEGDEREDMTPEEHRNMLHDRDHDELHAMGLRLAARIETLQFRCGKLEQENRALLTALRKAGLDV